VEDSPLIPPLGTLLPPPTSAPLPAELVAPPFTVVLPPLFVLARPAPPPLALGAPASLSPDPALPPPHAQAKQTHEPKSAPSETNLIHG
jgi:hypothetical protein